LIGQLLERKEQIELMLGDGFEENSKLVGEILTSVQPIRPHKSIIIFFGFFTGLFLSVAIIFFRENLSKRSAE
jgi:capsular polysaccharide biosynthesis protein